MKHFVPAGRGGCSKGMHSVFAPPRPLAGVRGPTTWRYDGKDARNERSSTLPSRTRRAPAKENEGGATPPLCVDEPGRERERMREREKGKDSVPRGRLRGPYGGGHVGQRASPFLGGALS